MKKKITITFLAGFLLLLTHSISAQTTDHNYAHALQLSLHFYDANKSGPGVEDGRLIWRGDSMLGDTTVPLTDGTDMSAGFISANEQWLDPDGDGTVDVSGGYFDAGDGVRFGLPHSYALSTLGYGYYEYKEAYAELGLDEHILELLKWGADNYIRSSFVDDNGDIVAFAYQVGTGELDHAHPFGPPELYDVEAFPRPVFFATTENPASDQMAGAAATMALTSLNYADIDADYAQQCLDLAITMYDHAVDNRGISTASSSFYVSSGDEDELMWAAVWLYTATNDARYLDDIESTSGNQNTGWLGDILPSTADTWENTWTHSWDSVWTGAILHLSTISDRPLYQDLARIHLDYWKDDPTNTSPSGYKAISTWGSARYNTATQLMALIYDKHHGTTAYGDWAKSQIDYLLGDNPLDRSYLVGYSDNYAVHPHHQAAHGSWKGILEEPAEHNHILYGALVGGPDTADQHNDTIEDYVYNEVAIDYNAGVVGALAGFYERYGAGQEIVPNFVPEAPNPDSGFFAEAEMAADNVERTEVKAIVYNRTTQPPRFSDGVTMRYFFDISEMIAAGQTIADVSLVKGYDQVAQETQNAQSADVAGPFPWDEANGIYYAEFSWDGVDIYDRRELQMGIVADLASDFEYHWDTSNDWSYAGLVEMEIVATDRIPVYENGILVAGVEPPGGTPIDPNVTPTIAPPTATPDPSQALKAQYRNGTSAADDGQLTPNVNIVNVSNGDVALDGVTLRYWFADDGAVGSYELNCDYAVVGCGNISASFGEVSGAPDGTTRYMDVTFSGGTLAGNSETGEINLRINRGDWQNMDETTHYSWDGSVGAFRDHQQIALYQDGVQVWGIDPAAPQVTDTPTDTPEPTATITPSPVPVTTPDTPLAVGSRTIGTNQSVMVLILFGVVQLLIVGMVVVSSRKFWAEKI